MPSTVGNSLVAAAPFTGPAAPFVAAAGSLVDFLGIRHGANQADLVTGAMARYDPLLRAIIYGDQYKLPVAQLDAQLSTAEADYRQTLARIDDSRVLPDAVWYLQGDTQHPLYGLTNFKFAHDYIRRARNSQGFFPTSSAPAASPIASSPTPGGLDLDSIYYTPIAPGQGAPATGWGIVQEVLDAVAPNLRRDQLPVNVQTPPAAAADNTGLFLVGGLGVLALLVLSSRSERSR